MPDLIDKKRTEAKVFLIARFFIDRPDREVDLVRAVIHRCCEEIDKQPTIEAEPVRNGRWQWENGYVGTMAVCSVCGSSPRGFYSLPKNQIGRLPIYKYCPRCGARMDGGIQND